MRRDSRSSPSPCSRQALLDFVNKTHFDRITMILRSAGFITNDLFGSQNAVNFAYILYLKGPSDGTFRLPIWSGLSGAGTRCRSCAVVMPAPESAFDQDIRQIMRKGCENMCRRLITTELPDTFGRAAAAVDGYVFGDQPLFPGV